MELPNTSRDLFYEFPNGGKEAYIYLQSTLRSKTPFSFHLQLFSLSSPKQINHHFPRMQFSKSLCGIAILVGPISFVLSALTFDQITNEVERLTGQVDDLISDINNINVATGDLNTNV